jgi:hypothetical protein
MEITCWLVAVVILPLYTPRRPLYHQPKSNTLCRRELTRSLSIHAARFLIKNCLIIIKRQFIHSVALMGCEDERGRKSPLATHSMANA